MTHTAPRRRALLVAPYFVPRRRVGVNRPLRFATHLPAHGWEPTVVRLRAAGAPAPREAARIAGLDVRDLAAPFDRTSGAEHGRAPRGRPGAPRRAGAGALDRAFPVDSWLPVLWAQAGRVARLVRELDARVIWATADPWSSLVLGARVAGLTGRPFVADLRDPWTPCEVRNAGRPAWVRTIDRRVEAWALGRAAAVTFTAEATADVYRAAFGAALPRIETIRNAFDLALGAGPIEAPPGPARPLPGDGPLRLGFFGRFRPLSPARPVADALAALALRHPDLVGRVEVVSFGPLDAADAAHARARGVADRFRVEAPVPPERAREALAGFDVLLLGTAPDRAEIVPAKLFDYLPAGRPILSLAPNPEVAGLVAATGTGVSADPRDPDAVAGLLAALAAAKRDGAPFPIPYAPDRRAIEAHEAGPATARLARLFDEVAGG